jgi:hypothetical protein
LEAQNIDVMPLFESESVTQNDHPARIRFMRSIRFEQQPIECKFKAIGKAGPTMALYLDRNQLTALSLNGVWFAHDLEFGISE